MSSDRCEVAVLGAGIAGCALAYHLVKRHVAPVLVYDPRTPAAGATGRAAGIVTEQLWSEWDVEVARASKAEYESLAARFDRSAYSANGFARWTHDAAVASALEDSVERLKRWGVEVARLGNGELKEKVPWGRFDDVKASVVCRTDGVVAPSAMTEIYAENARRDGVDFRLGTPFDSLARSEGRWALETGGGRVRAERVVVAAGAWSKRLLQLTGFPAPLAPYRTQAALLRPSTSSGERFWSVHDLDLDVYVRPESGGRILAGDGTERTEADPERFSPGADERFVGHLAESFQERFPGWADAELVRAWAGVCSSTPDRRPLVGPVVGADGLFVVAGFNGFGVMRAAGVAQRLAGLLAVGDGPSSELERLSPVLPGRFSGPVRPFSPRPGFTIEAGDDPRF